MFLNSEHRLKIPNDLFADTHAQLIVKFKLYKHVYYTGRWKKTTAIWPSHLNIFHIQLDVSEKKVRCFPFFFKQLRLRRFQGEALVRLHCGRQATVAWSSMVMTPSVHTSWQGGWDVFLTPWNGDETESILKQNGFTQRQKVKLLSFY